ncbi:MAG TPA: hypothetical protein VGF28_18090 [Thermoanaerobaculia bacterium]|jgi:hypothetical protein
MRRAVVCFSLLILACDELKTTITVDDPPAPAPVKAAAPAAPAVKGPKLRPVDEWSRDPALAAYRKQLLDALRRGDIEAVVALSDPKIRTDFSEGGSSSDFPKLLAEKRVRDALATTLSLGGTFLREDAFWTPYVYSKWPEDRDPFGSLVVIGENVPLRDAAGKTIALLSHDIVDRTAREGQVRTADGKVGRVDPKKLWSPVGFRAGFNRVGGKWRMNAFVAGD